jgi:hypothetical protein
MTSIVGLQISGISDTELASAFSRVLEEHKDTVASIQRSMEEADYAYRKYLDPNYEPDELIAKKDRAALNKAEKNIAEKFASLKAAYERPLSRIEENIRAIRRAVKNASDEVDGAVKAYEEKRKAVKYEQIRASFDNRNFNLIPLERLFDSRWLNKGVKLNAVVQELDEKITEVYRNIELLERMGPHGMTAKAIYLQTQDIGAAMRQVDELKANAERLAREQAEREERKLREQAEGNRREQRREERELGKEKRTTDLVAEALELPEAPPPEPEIIEFACRFWGYEEDLRAMREREWMSEHNIGYEKIEDYEHLNYA